MEETTTTTATTQDVTQVPSDPPERHLWRDFQQTPVFQVVDKILKMMGWMLVVEHDENMVATDVYPCRLADAPKLHLDERVLLEGAYAWMERHNRPYYSDPEPARRFRR